MSKNVDSFSLSKIFVKLVPVMSLGYLIFGLLIIVLNIGGLIPTIGSIFTQAFTGTAAMGGFATAPPVPGRDEGIYEGIYSETIPKARRLGKGQGMESRLL